MTLQNMNASACAVHALCWRLPACECPPHLLVYCIFVPPPLSVPHTPAVTIVHYYGRLAFFYCLSIGLKY